MLRSPPRSFAAQHFMPGIVVIRGHSVAMLMEITAKETGERFSLMTVQARVPTPDPESLELPAVRCPCALQLTYGTPSLCSTCLCPSQADPHSSSVCVPPCVCMRAERACLCVLQGMLDDGEFKGTAAKEIQEETGATSVRHPMHAGARRARA